MELQAVAHCLLNPHTRVKGLEGPKFKAEARRSSCSAQRRSTWGWIDGR
jgi:hypothetical protein